MRIPGLALGIAAMLAPALAGCSGSGNDNRAEKEYDKILSDSIRNLEAEIDSCNSAIDALRENEDMWMRDFVTIDDPRHAAPYMIFSSFQDKYPPAGTGLIARMADNGQFELVATLNNGRFNHITVTAGNHSATSDTVPHDGALNYTAGGLNTVLFTGPGADRIGHLIADNDLDIVKVLYFDKKQTGSYQIPNDYCKMITATFEFYNSRREINRLERRVPMLHRKIDILRSHIDNNSRRNEAKEKERES